MFSRCGPKMCILFLMWITIHRSEAEHVGDVRLLGGTTPLEGRMELFLGARGWFTTCDISWDINDAAVICRQLGYPGAALATGGTEFGRSVGKRPLARTWNCTGNERRIGQCPYQPTYACTDVVGVVCQDPSYLGCFNDVRGIFDSFLEEDYFVSSSLTVESCKKFCSDILHPIIGLKNGVGCYCGDRRDVISGHEKFPDAMCQEPCSGNGRQICGGARSSDHDSIAVFDVNLGHCDDPGVPTNGARLSDWFQFSDIVRFDCFPGYEMVGDSVIQCVLAKPGDGHATKWNSSTPVCVEKTQTATPTTTEQMPTTKEAAPSTQTTKALKTTRSRTTTVITTTARTTATPNRGTTSTTQATPTTASSSSSSTAEAMSPSTVEHTTRSNGPGPITSRVPQKSVTPGSTTTVKPTNGRTKASKTPQSSRPRSTVSPSGGDELFTFYTEFYENQTELIFDDDDPDGPRNGIFGIPEHLRTIVSVGGILVACVISILLITVTKRVLCSRRKAYHSIDIEHRISEEDLNGGGPYVYEPLTGSGSGSGSGHYARPRRHSLRKGFKRMSRRPWSEMEESRENADEEEL